MQAVLVPEPPVTRQGMRLEVEQQGARLGAERAHRRIEGLQPGRDTLGERRQLADVGDNGGGPRPLLLGRLAGERIGLRLLLLRLRRRPRGLSSDGRARRGARVAAGGEYKDEERTARHRDLLERR